MPDRCTVLVVDDHAEVRASLIAWFGVAFPEWQCLEASSAETAVGVVMTLAPDLVLMDIRLPGMDGIDGTRIIRSLQPKTRVVMLSNHEDADLQRRAAEAGACGYVFKRQVVTGLPAVLQELRGEGRSCC
jgi:DNA-binding NarL/FixJ family response regulator